MEKKVGFKLHKVKKNWVTIGVSTLSMVALAGGALLADQSAQADEVSLPNGDGFEQTDAGIESSASLINESYSPTLTEDAGHLSAVSSTMAAKQTQATSLHHLPQQRLITDCGRWWSWSSQFVTIFSSSRNTKL